MIVKNLGISDPLMLLHGKSYKVIDIERGWFRIIDETGEDYLYPPDLFIIEKINNVNSVKNLNDREKSKRLPINRNDKGINLNDMD